MATNKLSFSLLSFLVLLSLGACQQKFHLPAMGEQTITLAVHDTIHQLRLLPREERVKLYPDRRYYYYYGSQLASAESDYIGRVLHGDYTCFTRQKELALKGKYRKGLKNGLWKSWYTNGTLKVTQEWEKGLKDGIYKAYQQDGRLKEKGRYNNGDRKGNWVFYYPDGKRRLEETYRKDVQDGRFKEFYPEGTLKKSGKYKEGELHGAFKLYDEKGMLQEKLRYRNGELKEKKDKEDNSVPPDALLKNKEAEEKEKRKFRIFKKKEKQGEAPFQAEPVVEIKQKRKFFFFKKKKKEKEPAGIPIHEGAPGKKQKKAKKIRKGA